MGGTELGPAQWLPTYFEEALGWERSNSALALLFFSLAMATGRLVGSRLAQRISPATLIIVSAATCAVFILLMSQPFSPAVSLVSGVLLGVAVAPLWPTALAYTAGLFPSGGATMFSTLAAAGNAGGVLIPWAVGLAKDHWNLHGALGGIAILPLLLVLILILTRQTQGDSR